MVPKTRSSLVAGPIRRLVKVLALVALVGGTAAVLGISCTDNSGNGNYNPDASPDAGGGDGGPDAPSGDAI